MTPANQTQIEVCGGDYEHTFAIAGEYAGGLRLAYKPMRVQDIFVAMLKERRFEVCEFSLANYIILRARGEHWLTAVSVFPFRAFRHSLAITRRDSKLTGLDQLAGKRIGVEDYSMTAAVWFRVWEPFAAVSVIGVVGLFIGGWPIFKEAFENVVERRMTMELSMTIASSRSLSGKGGAHFPVRTRRRSLARASADDRGLPSRRRKKVNRWPEGHRSDEMHLDLRGGVTSGPRKGRMQPDWFLT